MYVTGGSGVARRRLRIACSRRRTSVIASPANATMAQPYPSSAASSACEPVRP